MFFILKNRKHDVYKKHVLIIFYYFWRVVLKNNYTTCRMIKNKILDIKIIFETYLKILKVSEHDFCSTKFREWLSKTIF